MFTNQYTSRDYVFSQNEIDVACGVAFRCHKAPTASAMPVTEGLPVAWPLPTKTMPGNPGRWKEDQQKKCQIEEFKTV